MEDKSLDKRIEIAQRIADFHKAKKPIQELIDEIGQIDFLEQFVGQRKSLSCLFFECLGARNIPLQYFYPMMKRKNIQALFGWSASLLFSPRALKNGDTLFFLEKAWKANNQDGFSCNGKAFAYSRKSLRQMVGLVLGECLKDQPLKVPGDVSEKSLREILVLANKLCKKPYNSISELMFDVVYKKAKAIKNSEWEHQDDSQKKKDFFKEISKVEKLFFID